MCPMLLGMQNKDQAWAPLRPYDMDQSEATGYEGLESVSDRWATTRPAMYVVGSSGSSTVELRAAIPLRGELVDPGLERGLRRFCVACYELYPGQA